MSVLLDPTARYGAAEAFLYDRLVAPAVLEMGGLMRERLLASVPRGARVLEVGSGGGQLAVAIAAERGDLSITGLDLSPDQVARATRRARALPSGARDRVRFVQGSALDLPFASGSFDGVISVASIKHWPDQARGLAECVRVVRPGGTVAIVEADRGCRFDDAARFVARFRIPKALHYVALAGFRTFVAGHSIDLDDARALAAALPEASWTVERIPGAPGLLVIGQRRTPVSTA